MTVSVFSWALALCLCLVYVHGQEICEVTGQGKMVTYSMPKTLKVKMPCKYQFSWIRCGTDEIKIIPGQEWDFKYRYFTNTLWVSVERAGTPYYWKGRTETKRILKYLENPESRTPFNVKESTMDQGGAPFWMKMIGDLDESSVTLKSANASWSIVFRPSGSEEKDKAVRNMAGIEFYCPNAKFIAESNYPLSLCGNNTDTLALKNRKKELKMQNLVHTAMFDILNNQDIVQTNPYCQAAVSLLAACPANKAEVVDMCAKIVRTGRVIKCLGKFHYDPMDVFNDCLRTNCSKDKNACERLKVAMIDCPRVRGVPKEEESCDAL